MQTTKQHFYHPVEVRIGKWHMLIRQFAFYPTFANLGPFIGKENIILYTSIRCSYIQYVLDKENILHISTYANECEYHSDYDVLPRVIKVNTSKIIRVVFTNRLWKNTASLAKSQWPHDEEEICLLSCLLSLVLGQPGSDLCDYSPPPPPPPPQPLH